MGRKYTDEQLQAISSLISRHGHLYYHLGGILEEEYSALCGDSRGSGQLYMAAWRMENGKYRERGFY